MIRGRTSSFAATSSTTSQLFTVRSLSWHPSQLCGALFVVTVRRDGVALIVGNRTPIIFGVVRHLDILLAGLQCRRTFVQMLSFFSEALKLLLHFLSSLAKLSQYFVKFLFHLLMQPTCRYAHVAQNELTHTIQLRHVTLLTYSRGNLFSF